MSNTVNARHIGSSSSFISYIYTYIHTRTFIKRLWTKRIQSAKGKTGGKMARAKEKGNQLIGKKMIFKRLFERGSGGSASDHGREVVP